VARRSRLPARAGGLAGRRRRRFAQPAVNVTIGPIVIATPVLSMFEARYAAPAADVDIVGEPTLTLTYRGTALPAATFLYAQVVDAASGRVVGDQVTPVPVLLDGVQRTITRKLEVVALRGRPTSDLRVQLVPSAPLYGPQRSAGSVASLSLSSSLPVVDATQSGR
jgi:ABC-2 type transport system ATP-binding protein